MPDEVMDVQPESSPGPESAQPSPTPSPAGAENTESQAGAAPQPEKLPPFHQHPRWQQMLTENRQLKAAVGQLAQQMQGLQQRAQQTGALSPEDRQAYQQAAQALKSIFEADPDLKVLLDVMKNGQQVLGMSGSIASLREQQLRQLERQGVSHILQLADTDGLPKDDKFRSSLVRLVEAEALALPDAKQRFAAGDLSVLDEAFTTVKASFLAHIQREGQQKLLDTKTKTRQLPPAPRGGAAGPPGLPKLDPQNPRAFEAALHKAATAMLAEKG